MFEIKKSDLAARIGILHTNHGKVETPAYVPVIHPVKQTISPKKITNHSLVVGHLAPYVIPRKKFQIVIVLRKSPYKLIPVYKKRRYSKQKTIENLGSEVLGITFYDALTKFGPAKTHQIDTSLSSVSKIVKRIEILFEKGKFQEDQVDWLGLISKKGDLKRFFPY